MERMASAMYDYLKMVAAVHCVQTGKALIDVNEALRAMDSRIRKLHEPLAWQEEVEKRIKGIETGKGNKRTRRPTD